MHLQNKNFSTSDQIKTPDKAKMETLEFGTAKVSRIVLQPGWKWSECNQPLAGTPTCQVQHLGILHSGSMKVTHEGGSEMDVAAGDAYTIGPGHDAWVVGDEVCVCYEFEQSGASWAGGD